MNKTTTRILQRLLREAGHYAGEVDGRRGPLTQEAVAAMLEACRDALPEGASGWSKRRRAIACLQLGCHRHDIDAGAIDGLWGPQTDYAAEALAEHFATGERPVAWRDRIDEVANPNGWPHEADLADVYGPPCEVPRVTVPCPWPLVLAWDPRSPVKGIGCHEAVADSLARVLARVMDHYDEARLRELGLDRYGGCHNCRRKRGGSSWSTHAWGVAIDWDPSRNRLRWGRDRARLARPEYEAWWACWEAEGWVSLGRVRNFDWMHVQAARP